MHYVRIGIMACIWALLAPVTPALAQGATPAPTTPDIAYCSQPQELHGVWKLVQLHEEPAAELSAEHQAKPHQMIRFSANGLYHEIKGKRNFRRSKGVNNAISKQPAGDTWQYILGDKGVIYFYKNQVFSHSVYCGLVTKSSQNYKRGQVILTPTSASQQKIFRTYRKLP